MVLIERDLHEFVIGLKRIMLKRNLYRKIKQYVCMRSDYTILNKRVKKSLLKTRYKVNLNSNETDCVILACNTFQ